MSVNQKTSLHNWWYLLYLLLMGLVACNEEKVPELTLDTRYLEIESIYAFANCRSPEGKYTTTVTSAADGSCTFTQIAEGAAFSAQLTADNQGFVLDEQGEVTDTLPQEAMEMIRSHEFHKLHSHPKHFFRDITYDQHLSKEIAIFQAKDRLAHPVKIYFDEGASLITKVELLNPLDTNQLIEITNKEWTDSDYGKMVKKLEIVQAKTDTFYFDYEVIEINQ